MHNLTNLVEQVLTKVRFNVRTVRRVNATKVGGVFESVEFETHTESKTSLTDAGLRRHYRSSKRAWGTSSEVGVAYVGDGRETMDALTNEPASCITFLSEQAFAPQNTRFWSRSRVWFQFTVGEDKPPMLSGDNRGKGVLSMDCSAKRSPL